MKMWTRCALKIVMIFEAVFLIAAQFGLDRHKNGIRKGAPISVTEVDGKRSKWKVSQYTDDGRVLSSLLHRNRLTVIRSYDLQIVNTFTLDEGLYTCYLKPIEVFSRIILKIKTNTSSVKKSLLFPGIIILVSMITFAVITSGIALIVHYKKQMHKKRTAPTKHIQKPEGSENESADTTEITNGRNLHTTSQENDSPVILAVTRIGVRNKVTSMVSVEHASTSLDNGSNVSENVDDEYEHPYITLIADNRAKDEHTYVTIKGNSNYENSHPFENAACGRFIDKNHHKIKKV